MDLEPSYVLLIFYCCSDLSIKFLIDALHRGNYLVRALQALSFVNLLLLLVTFASSDPIKTAEGKICAKPAFCRQLVHKTNFSLHHLRSDRAGIWKRYFVPARAVSVSTGMELNTTGN